MSFMPSPYSVVLLKDGRTGVVDTVTPDGRGDRVLIEKTVWSDELGAFTTVDIDLVAVTAWDIAEILWEPE